MRSVSVLLRATSAEVRAYLDNQYPKQREPWVAYSEGDPCLYINLSRDVRTWCEAERWTHIIRRVGSEPIEVIADVSGRHAGDAEVSALVTGLLSRFDGVAEDDYTAHLWSLTELRSGARFEGHPFFDYRGWYEEGE